MNAGYEVIYLGWNFEPERPQAFVLQADQLLILMHTSPTGLRGVFHLRPFFIHVLKALATLRPDVVHCVNEEMALLVLPFRRLLYRWLICDLYDSMCDRVTNHHSLIVRTLCLLSKVALAGSDHIIVTDERRLGRLGHFSHKATVIANVPVDPGPSLARNYPSGIPKVFVSGTLAKSRGLDVLLAAAQKVKDLQLVTAGRCGDDYAREVFFPHPLVTYLGCLTPDEALKAAAETDIMFAYYEPMNVNNIYASPNKIFDAMSVGRPVLVNSETLVSNWVLEHKLGLAAPYADVDALATILSGLAVRRRTLPEFASAARRLYEENFMWSIMEKRLHTIYESLNG